MRKFITGLVAGCLAILLFAVPAFAEQPGIRCVQNQLTALGFNTGGADGAIGSKTRKAAEDYRNWMLGGAGGAGWSEPALTALNGEAWCARIAKDHPEVAKFVQAAAPAVVYASSGKTGLVAVFTVDLPGKIEAFDLQFAYKTECENDHWAAITSPAGRTMVVMDRGLHRCSGSPVDFSGESTDAGPFKGTSAKGKWRFVFKDLDENFYSGFLQRVSVKITTNNKGARAEQTIRFGDLPKPVPNPS